MRLTINGENREFPEGSTLLAIMDELRITDKVMACAVNMEIVKKESWESYVPKEDDKIEMLHFVGGG